MLSIRIIFGSNSKKQNKDLPSYHPLRTGAGVVLEGGRQLCLTSPVCGAHQFFLEKRQMYFGGVLTS
jgi:hypothetical protein